MPQKPSIGRIVTYFSPPDGMFNARDIPAIVTNVIDEDEGRVTLTVFPPDTMPRPVNSGDVFYDESGDVEGTWRWPERV